MPIFHAYLSEEGLGIPLPSLRLWHWASDPPIPPIREAVWASLNMHLRQGALDPPTPPEGERHWVTLTPCAGSWEKGVLGTSSATSSCKGN